MTLAHKLMLVGAVTLVGCTSKPADPTTASNSAPKKTSGGDSKVVASARAISDPVEAAKDLVTRMGKVQKPSELAELMTNETAAGMGLMFTLVVGMAIGMSSLDPKADKSMQKDFEAMLKRYGMSEAQMSMPSKQLPPEIAKNGRKFLGEVAGFMDKLDKSSGGKGGIDISKDNKMKDVASLKFEKVSNERVKIFEPGKTEAEAEAVLEEGQWRLRIPNVMKDLEKGMSGGGKPGAAPVM